MPLLPIYIVGQTYPWRKWLRRIPSGKSTALASALALLLLAGLERTPHGLELMWEIVPSTHWMFLARRCSKLERSLYWVRLLFKNIFFLFRSLLFLMCVPRHATFMSDRGQRTLYPYLLHKWFMLGWENLVRTLNVDSSSMWVVKYIYSH